MNRENGALLSYITLILKELNETEPNFFALRQLLTNFYPLLNINELTRQGVRPLEERVKNLTPQDVASEPFRQELRQFLTEIEFFLNGAPQAKIATNTITPETLEALIKEQEEQAVRVKTAEKNWKTKWEQLIKEYNGRLDRLFIEKIPEIPPEKRVEIVYRISETVRKEKRQTKLKNESQKDEIVDVLRRNVMTELGLPANASPRLAEIIIQANIQAEVMALTPPDSELIETSHLAALLETQSKLLNLSNDSAGPLAIALIDIRQNYGMSALSQAGFNAGEIVKQLKNAAATTNTTLSTQDILRLGDWAQTTISTESLPAFFRLQQGSGKTPPLLQPPGSIPSSQPPSFIRQYLDEFFNRTGLSGFWGFITSSTYSVTQNIRALPVVGNGLGKAFDGIGGLFGGLASVFRPQALFGTAVTVTTGYLTLVIIFAALIVFFVFINPDILTIQRGALLPAGTRDFQPDYLAGGTCPIPRGPRISNDTFPNGGHGTTHYWDAMLSPVDGVLLPLEKRWSMPDKRMYIHDGAGCRDTNCSYYGYSLDVTSTVERFSEAVVPAVCAKDGSCLDEDIIWTVQPGDVYTTNVGQGIFLNASAGGHEWRIHLLHIVHNGQMTYNSKSNNVVGRLFDQDKNTHVHFEITMDGIPLDPTPFCDGSYKAGPNQCEVLQLGLCAVNDVITQFRGVFSDEADNAARICNKESLGGRPAIINDSCLNPNDPERAVGCDSTRCPHSADYSVGLFQINMLSANSDFPPLRVALDNQGFNDKSCYEAFTNWQDYKDPTKWGNLYCKIGNLPLLSACKKWFQDPANNTAYAKWLYDVRGWNPWSTARSCGIVQ